MPKKRITFEDAIDPPDTYQLLGLYEGFLWNSFAAIDSSDPSHGEIIPGSGTNVVRQTSPQALSSFRMQDDSDFSFKKAKFIDINDDDTGDSIWIRGYKDNVLVAQTFVFLDGAEPRTEKLGAVFKGIDFVSFVGNTSSWAMDDILVRVPDPPPLG